MSFIPFHHFADLVSLHKTEYQMYSPDTRYVSLPTDPESALSSPRPRPHLTTITEPFKSLGGTNQCFRLGLLTFLMLSTVLMTIYEVLWGGPMMFYPSSRPVYLNIPVDRPLVIRLAIMARVDAFERREAIRGAVLDGVPTSDVKLEYRFFVGGASGGDLNAQRVMRKLEHENGVHGDIVIMRDIEDVPERISEKRFNALKWANSIPPDQYDYAMTMDSDTFCRFRTLSRRLQYAFSSLRPREEPILIGRMSRQSVYYQNTIPDGNVQANAEDRWMTGPSYPYPVGIGYMLSSNLTATILSADPTIPHHINYPYDDVMIGSWVAGLANLGDPYAIFKAPAHRGNASHQVLPTPYLPYSVHTRIIDDPVGWHDYRHRGGANVAHAIGWETACVHRMSLIEMVAFRAREEIRMEWDY